MCTIRFGDSSIMRNIIGQAVVGDDLYGRTYELGRLWELLDHGQHILMLAPRRVGKTSLMLELRRAPRDNWDVLYIDVEGGEGPADFVAAILAALATIPRYRTLFEAIPFSTGVKKVLARLKSVAVDIDVLRVELKGALGREWVHPADQLYARLASLPDADVDPEEYAMARSILSRACNRAGVSLARLKDLTKPNEATFQSVLRDLQADGYLNRQGDHLEFRSNLLREWWGKHHVS